jgi:phosphate transport system protein
MLGEKYLKEVKDEVREFHNNLVKANEIVLKALEDCDTSEFDDAKKYVNNSTVKADEIDNLIIKILALYTPEARDLRRLVAYLKITGELSRASTNTRSFIKGFLAVCDLVEKSLITQYLVPLEEATFKCLKLTYEMLDIEDVDELKDKFEEVVVEEHKTDDLYDAIEEELLKNYEGNYETLNKVLKTVRKMEKIADRTIEVANLLMFYKLGGNLHNA